MYGRRFVISHLGLKPGRQRANRKPQKAGEPPVVMWVGSFDFREWLRAKEQAQIAALLRFPTTISRLPKSRHAPFDYAWRASETRGCLNRFLEHHLVLVGKVLVMQYHLVDESGHRLSVSSQAYESLVTIPECNAVEE